MTDAPSRLDEFGHSFVSLLIGDVLVARERVARHDSQLHRREAIRATFTAIEGATWMFREHIREVAREIGVLTPTADLALRERTFTVTEQGNIVEQVRFTTLPTVIRLTVKQAVLIDAAAAIDFSEAGWSALHAAIDVRNRVTHPKQPSDLQVSTKELRTVSDAFEWLLSSTEACLRVINTAFRTHARGLRLLVDELRAGDPRALQDYWEAILSPNSDD